MKSEKPEAKIWRQKRPWNHINANFVSFWPILNSPSVTKNQLFKKPTTPSWLMSFVNSTLIFAHLQGVLLQILPCFLMNR